MNDVGFIDDAAIFHMIGPRHVTQPDFGALDHIRNVSHAQGRAALCLENGLLDVLHATEEAQRADIHLLHADLDKATAGIDVVVGKLLLHLADA